MCLLHINELPFRHAFEVIDGKTTRPGTFEGSVGKMIQKDITSMPIVKFSPVNGNIQEISKSLSTDQKYLYDICLAVQLGVVPPKLASRSPGALHHARWLTRANRILRLYISTKTPSRSLQDLVKIILQIYAPSWFWIKAHPKACEGSQNFWFMMHLVKSSNIDGKLQAIMENVLLRNAYFAHPENILLSMMTDSRQDVRELALQKIIQANTMHCMENREEKN